jgi:hypothetical protein
VFPECAPVALGNTPFFVVMTMIQFRPLPRNEQDVSAPPQSADDTSARLVPCEAQRRSDQHVRRPFDDVCADHMALGREMVCGVKRIERIRLYPSAHQEQALRFVLDVTRELYNAALQERKDAYRLRAAYR